MASVENRQQSQDHNGAATVVLIHGLFMPGWDLLWLQRRLHQAGFNVSIFRYPTVLSTPERSATALSAFCRRIQTPTLHFVAHSLGGLIVRHLCARDAHLPWGRVVTLGTPHSGSAVAKKLSRYRVGTWWLGRSLEAGLLGEVPAWHPGRDLGSIAGNSSLGLGKLVARFDEANDGTVSVSETKCPQAKDHIVLDASHMGLLFSRAVADQATHFLRYGYFDASALYYRPPMKRDT